MYIGSGLSGLGVGTWELGSLPAVETKLKATSNQGFRPVKKLFREKKKKCRPKKLLLYKRCVSSWYCDFKNFEIYHFLCAKTLLIGLKVHTVIVNLHWRKGGGRGFGGGWRKNLLRILDRKTVKILASVMKNYFHVLFVPFFRNLSYCTTEKFIFWANSDNNTKYLTLGLYPRCYRVLEHLQPHRFLKQTKQI